MYIYEMHIDVYRFCVYIYRERERDRDREKSKERREDKKRSPCRASFVFVRGVFLVKTIALRPNSFISTNKSTHSFNLTMPETLLPTVHCSLLQQVID